MWPIPETISFAELPPPVTVRYNNTRTFVASIRSPARSVFVSANPVNGMTLPNYCRTLMSCVSWSSWTASTLRRRTMGSQNSCISRDSLSVLVVCDIDGCEISIVNVSKFKRLSGLRELSLSMGVWFNSDRNLVQVEEVVDRAAESFPCL